MQVNGPSVYRTYLAAAQNLGLSDDASGYWALHIKEDERHGRQMVEDVAVPLVDMYVVTYVLFVMQCTVQVFADIQILMAHIYIIPDEMCLNILQRVPPGIQILSAVCSICYLADQLDSRNTTTKYKIFKCQLHHGGNALYGH